VSHAPALCFALALLGVWATPPLEAQVRVNGRTVDEHARPVVGAAITVDGSQRRALSRDDGTFTILLDSGRSRIRARRLGFLEDEQSYVVGERSDSLVFVLRALPALLAGVSVDAPLAPPLAQTVTAASVRQAPALLEPDVFRSLLLLPGVSQPNDLRGRINLAGGSSDETGVRLDGHPLQDPFHLFGLLGAFNVGALDKATVSIHHVPLESQGFLSGMIALDTKSPENSGEATLSILAAGATVSRKLPAHFDVLVSGRASYLKAVADAVYSDAQLARGDIPLYDVADGLVRVGRDFASGARWETIAFTTRDAIANGRLRQATGYAPLAWGETLVGTRVRAPIGPWSFNVHASVNNATIIMDERSTKPDGDWVNVDRRIASLSADAELTQSRLRWRVGSALDVRRYEQGWKVSEGNVDIFSPRTPLAFGRADAASRASVFGEVDASLGARTMVSTGARLWHSAGALYLAPQLFVTHQLAADFLAEGSMERRHQFDAELEEPIEGTVAAPRFLLSEPRVADVAAASLVWRPHRLAESMELRLQTFTKRYRRDARLRDLEIGQRLDTAPADFPAFYFARATSTGIGLSGKGAWRSGAAVQAAYTFQRTRDEQPDGWFPSDVDIPHAFTGFANLPLGWLGLDMMVAGQMHSGTAITPVALRLLVPMPEFFRGFDTRFLPGQRNSFRLAPYQRLDVGVRRRWTPAGAELTLTLQVLNVLYHQNPRDVDWHHYFDLVAAGSGDAAARSVAGVPGLPILPSIGLELRW